MAISVVNQTLTRLGRNLNSAMVLTFTWSADTDTGGVLATATTSDINSQIAGWFITKAITNPGDGAAAPTADYGITLVDSDGIDLTDGGLALRSATLSEQVLLSAQVDASGFTFAVADNSSTAATGVCKIFLNR